MQQRQHHHHWPSPYTAEKRAQVALECLGLGECFDAVYGAGFMSPACKPQAAAFKAGAYTRSR
jgi:hypothetical protein